ncbi:helix-turn-helix domain-containing protein [Spirillospora sp. NPDC029432]|uniref:TetR/AcrR family transcriptional regulator n=1 Tax=Spirillospora sp. NPDC029432 TaxID=3154599 RepID=UPI0034530164
MRADARRNRERIVEAALRTFAERGPAASMEEIAQVAGVGVGTLYRHFPDRRALLEEIASEALERLIAFARTLAPPPAAHDSGAPGDGGGTPGWDALLRLVDYSVAQPYALLKTVGEEAAAVPPDRLREADALIAGIAERAQKEGTLRSDVTPAEVVAIFGTAVCRPGARADDPLIRVMLDGLRV